MLKILWNRGEIAPEEQFLLLFTIFSYLMLDFYVKTRIGFSLRDKRLFEITEVEITRVDCISISYIQTDYLVLTVNDKPIMACQQMQIYKGLQILSNTTPVMTSLCLSAVCSVVQSDLFSQISDALIPTLDWLDCLLVP